MTELVVLVDPNGTPIGTADKATVHTTDTPLHLAFSCWVIRDGQVLLTRRALHKITWPGVWTNAFCGHPGPDEDTADAVIRRASFELGLKQGSENAETQLSPECVVPEFSYRAVDVTGIVEHEICPVYVLELPAGVEPAPNPDEVCAHEWVDVDKLAAAADATPFVFSQWMLEELATPQLRARLGL